MIKIYTDLINLMQWWYLKDISYSKIWISYLFQFAFQYILSANILFIADIKSKYSYYHAVNIFDAGKIMPSFFVSLHISFTPIFWYDFLILHTKEELVNARINFLCNVWSRILRKINWYVIKNIFGCSLSCCGKPF